jgi:hypothetical protein
MSGISDPVGMAGLGHLVSILVEDTSYLIDSSKFPRTADDKSLETYTTEVLDVFKKAERAVNRNRSLTLGDEGRKHLASLATWGQAAYNRFFQADRAKNLLRARLAATGGESAIPTFVSQTLSFPWEVLYEGDDPDQPEAERFWGYRYVPARILQYDRNISEYPPEHALPARMLFCLHDKLLQAHGVERPAIEQLVCHPGGSGRFQLLGPASGLDREQARQTRALLKYLYKVDYNVVHFACHCTQGERGDVLEVSYILNEQVEGQRGQTERMTLETYEFDLGDSDKFRFSYQPFVFLNACQSSGGGDELRNAFNFPSSFMRRGAAAVIATACPVPDRFAAAFAQEFYTHFLQERLSIGESLRRSRRHFWEQDQNPLGLAYGLYSPAHYRVSCPSTPGGLLS